MKSLRASGSDEHMKSVSNTSRSQHQTHRQTSTSTTASTIASTANPKDVSITIANQTLVMNSTPTNGNTNATKKHSLGFRHRFSLRRLFNQSTIGRTVNQTRHNRPPKEKHSSDSSGSATDTKGVTNSRSVSHHRPTCSTIDVESYSLSSGRSEYFNATVPSFVDNSSCSSG
ncbi:unnamed protein product, partial [Medioppia subpectinata]